MEKRPKIGILYICTGKYVIFWREFFQSMEENFLPEIEKHYFVFTDSSEIDFAGKVDRIHVIHQDNLGWPDNTLKRFHVFLNQEESLSKMDYLFFCNANLQVLQKISAKEFLPENNERLVAVQHPGFFNKVRDKFTYDNNSRSTAYIASTEGEIYVAGGLNGGYTSDFLQAMKVMKQNIDQDLQKGIVALWHDESHWNRYIIGRSDVKILDAAYLYPEGWNIPFEKKILIRDKVNYGGHDFLRNQSPSLLSQLKIIIKKFIKSLYI